MKKVFTFLVAVLITASSFAQSPEKMSYQAVLSDSNDNLINNQAVGMRLSILQNTATGTAVYVETQTVTTNDNGLVTLAIGTGSVISGDFATIDWGGDSYFIQTEMDPTGGDTYTLTGASQLLSVPYALYAKTSGSSETNATPTYTLNTLYPELGGYVIEINTDGTHGLVVAMQDQGISSWYEANDLLSDANNHDVNGAKFKDWRLPTKRELNLMYGVYIGGNGAVLNGNYYWSSTESDDITAWIQAFDDGDQFLTNKSFPGVVRAVRAF
ncbi:DUF1566 domain-containing protein [Patiriisocius sp. Uisw_047]|uniref:Lcl C-terminal domain-containing protein n=1 Tax=Patiriisocius sp. Uisw_047 TaxID=3230969 RepID=UPI0039E88CC3